MNTVISVAAIYIFIMLGLRALGKRDFSQLSPFDLITLLLIPEIASEALTRGDASITNAVIGLSTLLLLVFLTSLVTHRFRSAERVIEGKPTVLVENGSLLARQLNRERITPGEIFSEMHQAGLHRLEQVRWAILETDGRISIVPVDQHLPAVATSREMTVA